MMPWVEPSGQGSWRVRFRREDGSVASLPGFASQADANDHIDEMIVSQRKGTWIDPFAGQTTVAEYAPKWLDSLDIDQRTEENYQCFINKHIVPKWGTTALDAVTNLAVRGWEKTLRAAKLAKTTVDSIIKCFSLMLSDAVGEFIGANPIQPRRRGRRRRAYKRTPRKVWAEPGEVLAVADQVALRYGPEGAVLVVTAAWTGARWGELIGLQRHNLHLFDDNTGVMILDPDVGALHEPNKGDLYLGPLKTEESAREITLPTFLVIMLRAHLLSHQHPHVFVTPQKQLHRRSNFSRRAFRPAADGNARIPNPEVRLLPVKPGLTFHGLRHSHKTWMIDDGIAEIAQALRLGHILGDKVRETYSHVAAAMEARLIAGLQTRWEKAVTDRPADAPHTRWRELAVA